jgi:alpha-beta hydrolase superfamily lysophospholipase
MAFLDLPRPPTLPAPVLVLGADADSIFTRDQVEAAARAYKTTADWLEGVAHDAMLDPRWRVAADRILEWLWRPNGPGR